MPHLTATRHLGATGISVLLIGYGTAPLDKEKTMPRAEAVRCLHHAIDAGITDLDTSPDYAKESQEGKSALFWLHDTVLMGWQQQDEPALGAYSAGREGGLLSGGTRQHTGHRVRRCPARRD